MPDLWADSLEAHRALVRGKLLAAFAELAAEQSVSDITLTAVAERAGIARSAVYNYVASKHDLLLEYTLDVTSAWSKQLAASAHGSVVDRFEQYVAATLRVFAEDPVAGAEDIGRFGVEHEGLMSALSGVREHLRALLAEGVADGSFSGDPAELETFVFAALSGYHPVVVRGDLDTATAAATVSRLLVHGLRGARRDEQ